MLFLRGKEPGRKFRKFLLLFLCFYHILYSEIIDFVWAGRKTQVHPRRGSSPPFFYNCSNPIFRKVMPSEYKLFQAADLLCSLTLIKLKLENGMFSKSEEIFFGNIRDLKKNYLKPLGKKEWI